MLKNCNFNSFFVKLYWFFMKYKKIPKDYIKICADRLTRFKPVYEKYERVFSDILNKFLICAPDNLSDKNHLSIEDFCAMAVEIFNQSIPYEIDLSAKT